MCEKKKKKSWMAQKFCWEAVNFKLRFLSNCVGSDKYISIRQSNTKIDCVHLPVQPSWRITLNIKPHNTTNRKNNTGISVDNTSILIRYGHGYIRDSSSCLACPLYCRQQVQKSWLLSTSWFLFKHLNWDTQTDWKNISIQQRHECLFTGTFFSQSAEHGS